MKKLASFILILLFLSAAVAFAQQQLPRQPILLYYWVRGRVLDPAGNAVPNRKVMLYKEDLGIDQRIEASTDDNGRFEMNLYELFCYQNVPILFGGGNGRTYVIAVPTQDNLGFTGVRGFNANQGYFEEDLTLVVGQGPQDPDRVAPVIDGTTPANNAGNVAVNQEISITFSEAMNRDSIQLACQPDPGGWVIDRWENGNRTVVFGHNNFANNTQYAITVQAANDLAGNALAAPFAFQFTTLVLDDVAPAIDFNNNTPRDGAVNVAIDQPITIAFGEAMDPDSIRITFDPDPGGLNLVWNGDNTAVTIMHNDFAFNALYTVRIVVAKDAAGNDIAGDLDFTFTTVAGPPPAGTVRLGIARAGNDIRLGWEGPDPDIYVLIGDFANDGNAWQRVGDGFRLDPDNNNVLHLDQVGRGDAQVYYKALVAGIDRAGDHPQGGTFLAQAPVAGKVNRTIAGGNAFTFISSPFGPAQNSFDNVIGQQLDGNQSSGRAVEIWQWGGTSFNNTMYLHPQNGWVAKVGEAFNCQLGRGYVIRSKSGQNDKVITLVGRVGTDVFEFPAIGENRFYIFGNPFPINVNFNNADLPAGVNANASSGRADQIWDWTANGFGSMLFCAGENPFDFQVKTGAAFNFEPGKAYIYRRASPDNGFTWQYNPYD